MKTRKPDYAALISEFESGDLSKSEFCRRFKVKFANFSYRLKRKRNSSFRRERFLPITIVEPGVSAMIKISGAEINMQMEPF